MVDAFMGGRPVEHRHPADHLETLHTIEADLAELVGDEGRKHEIQEFIDATRVVLHALLQWLTGPERPNF
jgi:hypothetical protein